MAHIFSAIFRSIGDLAFSIVCLLTRSLMKATKHPFASLATKCGKLIHIIFRHVVAGTVAIEEGEARQIKILNKRVLCMTCS